MSAENIGDAFQPQSDAANNSRSPQFDATLAGSGEAAVAAMLASSVSGGAKKPLTQQSAASFARRTLSEFPIPGYVDPI